MLCTVSASSNVHFSPVCVIVGRHAVEDVHTLKKEKKITIMAEQSFPFVAREKMKNAEEFI